MSKVSRAVAALQEAADALEALPETLRRKSFLGSYCVATQSLRDEAAWLDGITQAFQKGLED